MDDFTIEQIFTKIGPKLIFKKKYRQFQSHQAAELSSDMDEPTTDTASVVSSNSTSTSNIILEPDSDLANILNTELGNFKTPLPLVPASAVQSSYTNELDVTFCCPKKMKKSSIFSDVRSTICFLYHFFFHIRNISENTFSFSKYLKIFFRVWKIY